ncbi:antibiotic biosynthesis monooxygenase family protein [Polycladidibacter hongkongensis]|uniref:antibiotic biosynthesis monooxygenase family protein n=1 Tax=Polycladidibacter hongkongensis TaxID=1647556 RepID=UPI00082A349D|nr:antibiotic biosynthesis monooxygenase [Pseudovibrio hongkongensis]
MYIAMNRFRVVHGHEEEFETIWKNRERRLSEMPGFVEFKMLRGSKEEAHSNYASHTLWESFAAFEAWTQSEQFLAAHKNAGKNKHIYAGGPHFEGYEVFMHEKA